MITINNQGIKLNIDSNCCVSKDMFYIIREYVSGAVYPRIIYHR